MNRKQKIIVSITGIFLVLMILVGLTYAYFLTKITGNTNEKSISVTTANLVLEYGENTNVVQGISNAEPGYSVEKIFTATNKGNSTVTYGAALESIVNELSRQQDLVYTLTCTSYLKNGFSLASDGNISGTVDGTCNGVTMEKQFPSTSTLSVMITNTIDTTHTQAYKLTITYKEMGVDQSEDMNKTFSAKVNIVEKTIALTADNPYRNHNGTLKKKIIDKAMLENETPWGMSITAYNPESGEPEYRIRDDGYTMLDQAIDDDGYTYYYVGNPTDNYLDFAGMCWRILRINGDGSIRIILSNKEKTCSQADGEVSPVIGNANWGYDIVNEQYIPNYLNPSGNETNSALVNVFKTFQTEKLNNYLSYLKAGGWCLGDNAYDLDDKNMKNQINKEEYYTNKKGFRYKYDVVNETDSKLNLNFYNLKCENYGKIINKFSDDTDMYVGTLIGAEIEIVGYNRNNTSFLSSNYSAWTLSLYSYEPENKTSYEVYLPSTFENNIVSNSYNSVGIAGFNNAIPVIQLKSDIKAQGNGTKENPYIIAS